MCITITNQIISTLQLLKANQLFDNNNTCVFPDPFKSTQHFTHSHKSLNRHFQNLKIFNILMRISLADKYKLCPFIGN